ncbi:hypothetical protein WR164_00520 [Philodulcilactobacillus myokoensis]|uniref:Uncharacterized protein n=1 Tax=Philodulcilactobacillus myokoensis TaxID=2929573 RepID=A0A9W6ES68_9LACO|nr:hypothetical protein WR164_00520 [Philodulcilactobacillus myokoensis]
MKKLNMELNSLSVNLGNLLLNSLLDIGFFTDLINENILLLLLECISCFMEGLPSYKNNLF